MTLEYHQSEMVINPKVKLLSLVRDVAAAVTSKDYTPDVNSMSGIAFYVDYLHRNNPATTEEEIKRMLDGWKEKKAPEKDLDLARRIGEAEIIEIRKRIPQTPAKTDDAASLQMLIDTKQRMMSTYEDIANRGERIPSGGVSSDLIPLWYIS